VPAVLPPHMNGSEVVRRFAQACEPLVLGELSDDGPVAETDSCPGIEPGPVMFLPLRQRDSAVGYIAIYRRRGRARYTVADVRVVLMLAAYLSSALECQRLASGAQKNALTDDLTDVYNARFLKAALKREFTRATRHGGELSVILIDVDQMNAHNQENGEMRGSILLREIAGVLASQVRAFDILAKYDDDEFMLLLPETGVDGALQVAERARVAVETHSFSQMTSVAVTVSMGVGSFPREGVDEKAVVAKARRALALAKERGRNRVESLIQKAA
jgi:diguanylate cyclase (GGDEF)-like protein